MGNPSFGAGMHRGMEIGLDRGIKIGLRMAAEAARLRRVQIGNRVLLVVRHATPAVLNAARRYRSGK